MTESNEKELIDQIQTIRCPYWNKHCESCLEKNQCEGDVDKAISLCRTHFGREWAEKIEELSRERVVSTSFIDDIKRILIGEG